MGPMGQGFEPPPPIQFDDFVEIAIACLKGTAKAIGSRTVSAIAPWKGPRILSGTSRRRDGENLPGDGVHYSVGRKTILKTDSIK